MFLPSGSRSRIGPTSTARRLSSVTAQHKFRCVNLQGKSCRWIERRCRLCSVWICPARRANLDSRPTRRGELMETILNLVWLVITLATILVWRFRWTRARRNPRHTIRAEAVALLCFIALLFPVISLTDDLHPEIVAVDAVGGKRNACLMVAGAPHARTAAVNSVTHTALGVLPKLIGPVSSAITDAIPPAEFHALKLFAGSFPGRSPPLL